MLRWQTLAIRNDLGAAVYNRRLFLYLSGRPVRLTPPRTRRKAACSNRSYLDTLTVALS
jgi:hypothetical protein